MGRLINLEIKIHKYIIWRQKNKKKGLKNEWDWWNTSKELNQKLQILEKIYNLPNSIRYMTKSVCYSKNLKSSDRCLVVQKVQFINIIYRRYAWLDFLFEYPNWHFSHIKVFIRDSTTEFAKPRQYNNTDLTLIVPPHLRNCLVPTRLFNYVVPQHRINHGITTVMA